MTLSLFHSPHFKQLRTFKRSARLFLLATIVDGIVYSAWGLFFNFYIIERGFDRNYLGLVNALPALAMLLLGIPLGMLSDRIGRKRAMLAGVATTMVCMALQVTLRQPELILAAAFLGGVSNSLYYLSQAPFMMKASDQHNRTLLFSMNFGLVTLAGAIGALFAGHLPGFFGGLLHVQATSAMAYRAVLLMSVALSFLTLIPLTMIREEEKRSEDKGEVKTASRPTSPWSDLKQVLRKPLTYRLALPNLMIGLGAAILIPYINVFFRERFAMPDQNLGVLFSVSAVLTGSEPSSGRAWQSTWAARSGRSCSPRGSAWPSCWYWVSRHSCGWPRSGSSCGAR